VSSLLAGSVDSLFSLQNDDTKCDVLAPAHSHECDVTGYEHRHNMMLMKPVIGSLDGSGWGRKARKFSDENNGNLHCGSRDGNRVAAEI